MSELAQDSEIHEQINAPEKLRQVAARLQTLIDTVPSFLWTSFPDGSKEFLNRRWYEYTGLTLEQGKGWGWKVVVHPDDLDRLVREWLDLLNDPKPGELETRIRRYDGEYRWFLIRVLPEFDAEGNVVRWLGSDTDIEDRKALAFTPATSIKPSRLVADPELSPLDLTIAPNGNIVVSSERPFGAVDAVTSVREYDAVDGHLVRVFSPNGKAEFCKPRGLRFGPGGLLYCVARNEVVCFDFASGESLGAIARLPQLNGQALVFFP
jgi:PAS domain S-box-containing protein